MEWQVAVALGVAVPIILFPAAFVWYLNTSGLYQVIRDALRRRQQRRKAETLRKVTIGIAPKE